MKSASIRFAVVSAIAAGSIFAQGYKLTSAIKIGGSGGWDYLTADSEHRRLYVSHAGDVVVIDLDSGKTVGSVTGMSHIHGIAIASDLDRGFITDGGKNEVVAFNPKTLAVEKHISAGTNPDGVVYDSASKRVFAFNGRSKNATVIDAKAGTVVGSIALDGKPEFPVSDGKGTIYVNIEDKGEILRIDPHALKVEATWPLKPCESPSGLAIDSEGRRLFSVCDNKMMAVVNADSGKVIATPEIGEGPDAAAFDPGTKLAFSSNGESGTVTVIRADSADKYSVAETVHTAESARTMALDTQTHKLYLSAADLEAASASSNGRPRRAAKPDSFRVLVLSR